MVSKINQMYLDSLSHEDLREEIIDKTHPVISKKVNKKSFAYMSFYKKWDIYFSYAAVEEYNLLSGDYIHFKRMNDKLFFYVDNNKDTGFAINKMRRDKSIPIKIFSRPLYEYLQKIFEIEPSKKYNLAPTNKKESGNKLIEIILE